MSYGSSSSDGAQCGRHVAPALVGVDGEARARAGRFADGRDARLVALGQVAGLDLEHGDPVGGQLLRRGRELLGLVPAVGDDFGQRVARGAAEQVDHRAAERLALQVPQGHLEPASGCLVADRPQLALPNSDDLLDAEGVAAERRRPKVLADDVGDGPQRLAGELVRRTGLAVADQAFVGLDGDQVARSHRQRRRGDDERGFELQLERLDVYGGDLHDAPPEVTGLTLVVYVIAHLPQACGRPPAACAGVG